MDFLPFIGQFVFVYKTGEIKPLIICLSRFDREILHVQHTDHKRGFERRWYHIQQKLSEF